MKKIISILLSIIICFALISCSCASNNNQSAPAGSENDVGEEYPDIWD